MALRNAGRPALDAVHPTDKTEKTTSAAHTLGIVIRLQVVMLSCAMR